MPWSGNCGSTRTNCGGEIATTFPTSIPSAGSLVRLVLEECGKGRELTEARRKAAIAATLEMVERLRQEVRKVGFLEEPGHA